MKRKLLISLMALTNALFALGSNMQGNVEKLQDTLVVDKSHNEEYICRIEPYMSLKGLKGIGSQGGACYDDYFIQGYVYNKQLSFYNLKEKRFMTTVEVPTDSIIPRCHSNTLNFSNLRYDENDFFPLLYVSSGYTNKGVSYIYVYRITMSNEKDNETFLVTHVQTICLHGFRGWTEGVIDTVSNELWIKYQRKGNYGYARFKMPNPTMQSVNIYYKDAESKFSIAKLPQNSNNQGHLFYGERIFFTSGVPSKEQEIALLSINPSKGTYDYIIDLDEVGLIDKENPKSNAFEPESVIVYNGHLMICYRTAIYVIDLKKKSEQQNIPVE